MPFKSNWSLSTFNNAGFDLIEIMLFREFYRGIIVNNIYFKDVALVLSSISQILYPHSHKWMDIG